MRLSTGFWQTYKETPNDAEIPSHQLMIRAGLIQKSTGGIYNYLPVGLRSIQKFEKIVREEHNKRGCLEVTLSVVTPGDLWQETGRWDQMGPLMLRFKDRGGRDLCMSPTNEEAVTDLFRKTIKSYKQLPVTLYQINTKFRDEIRPRFGLMRGREFTMKDAYSFHEGWESLDKTYEMMYEIYTDIFKRAGLDFIAVMADAGAMGDAKSKTHEFQVLAASGEDRVVRCKKCNTSANIEKALTKRTKLAFDFSASAINKVDTPNRASITDVCAFLKRPEHTSLKSLVYSAITGEIEKHYLVLLLGDDTLNEVKLKNFLGCDHLRPSPDHVLAELKMPKGYIGPVGLTPSVQIIFDSEVNLDASYVTGAMEVDKHYLGFIPKRDLKNFEVTSLRESHAGDLCASCEGVVEEIKGIEVGHIFQLGDKYTKAMSVTILDKNGKAITPVMGCYGIGITRTVASAIEQHNDEKGIIWPVALAPYHVYLGMIAKSDEMRAVAEEIYGDLLKNDIEVMFDDRGLQPGVMFNDADLLGLPLRILFGERDYQKDGTLELKVRRTGETLRIKKESLVTEIKRILGTLP